MLAIKAGDTLDLACQLLEGGMAVDITGWQINSQVRSQGRLVGSFDVAITDGARGEYEMLIDTSDWPAGSFALDIRYADALGRVMHSCTVRLMVHQPQTVLQP